MEFAVCAKTSPAIVTLTQSETFAFIASNDAGNTVGKYRPKILFFKGTLNALAISTNSSPTPLSADKNDAYSCGNKIRNAIKIGAVLALIQINASKIIDIVGTDLKMTMMGFFQKNLNP